MKRFIYLLAVIVSMAAVWAQESGVSVVDFTQGAGTWHRRVWKNGGKEFELSELSAVDSSSIKRLLHQALTNKINDREIFMKGIDYSYYYEEN